MAYLKKKIIISIDGPAGSGKREIAKYLSKKYKLFHLDSGILYRRLALKILKNKINYEKNNILLTEFIFSQKKISPRNHISLRTQEISSISSKIAKLPVIRNFINIQQKKIIKLMSKKNKGSVIDGRDIGSKVFKDADIKLFIEVNVNIRAKRRHKQLIAQGEKSIYAQILKEITLRDKLDKNRKHSPLVIPKGAFIIDNSYNFEITKTKINQIIKQSK